MNEKLASAKNFVKRYERRVLITTTIVATTAAVLMSRGVKSHNEFLKEHNLFDEYYQPENSY